MTRRELATIESLITWAVDPQPPLPPVAETDAVAALVANIEHSPGPQRIALRAALAAAGALQRGALDRAPFAPLADLVTALSHLAYYGDLGVSRVIGFDPVKVAERGHATRTAEARW